MRRVVPALAVWAVLAIGAESASAQTWSPDTLFPESFHDFGTVARGTKLRYTFWLVNTTNSDIKIVGWQPKCGCTEVKVGARDVPPGTRTPIEATLDTTRFPNIKKNSGLTLNIAGPTYAQKDLNVTCFVRGDMLLDPGVADFGNVNRGTKPVMVMNLTYQGGQAGWAIQGAKTISDNVSAEIKGPFQAVGGGVQYQITANVNPSAPAGYLKDEIVLKTNDPSNPAIPISVSANIQAAVVISPGNLVFGRVKAGESVTKEVLVRSSQKFKITDAKSAKTELSAGKVGEVEAPLQKLTITLKAPMRPGPFHAEMQVSTNLKDEPPAKFTAYATVVQ
jgi:Protein of unknown function (DUF1573)